RHAHRHPARPEPVTAESSKRALTSSEVTDRLRTPEPVTPGQDGPSRNRTSVPITTVVFSRLPDVPPLHSGVRQVPPDLAGGTAPLRGSWGIPTAESESNQQCEACVHSR